MVKKDYNENVKTVRLQLETYERLRKYGHTPTTFNDILVYLLDRVEEKICNRSNNIPEKDNRLEAPLKLSL